MSIVDKIENLTIDHTCNKETLEELEEALRIYHRLVDEGKLIPRGNTLESNYVTCTFSSNFSK